MILENSVCYRMAGLISKTFKFFVQTSTNLRIFSWASVGDIFDSDDRWC